MGIIQCGTGEVFETVDDGEGGHRKNKRIAELEADLAKLRQVETRWICESCGRARGAVCDYCDGHAAGVLEAATRRTDHA